jgi:uncharacterized protein
MYRVGVSLRSKLERLTLPNKASSVMPSSVRSTPVLDDLRDRMQRILERSLRNKPRKPHAVETEDLPFLSVETERGMLHVRRLEIGASHRVGNAPVFAARHVDSRLLSLLALDPRLAEVDFGGALYLDTETTGLSGGTGTVAFLVGLAFFSEDKLVVEQLLVRNLGEEAPMLERVLQRMREASSVVTFNGKAFDLPLLRTRFVMARVPEAPDLPHLDLLHVARRLHKPRGVECRLVSIERDVLGFERHDDTPSGEVSACYLHFLRTGEARPLLGVVEHNTWDVLTMAALAGLYGEPIDSSRLLPDDLAGVSLTLKRARAFNDAHEAALRAMEGKSPLSFRAGAEVAKAMGDRDRALALFERIAEEVDCKKTRLELAKLYEHHAKDAERALQQIELGTTEDAPASSRRRARLIQKTSKKSQQRLF